MAADAADAAAGAAAADVTADDAQLQGGLLLLGAAQL